MKVKKAYKFRIYPTQ
ncbi:helix-turn-helix domain-containing protein, partial [Schinkia azotoformans]